jgi:hypothetical protein
MSTSSSIRESYWQELTSTAGAAWNQFWFTAIDPLPLAVVRIGVGLVTVLHLLSYSTDLVRWFGANGILPPETIRALDSMMRVDVVNAHYSYLMLADQPTELWLLHGLALAAAICLLIGLFTRVASVLTLVVVLSYVHRAPMLTGHVEPVLAFLLFYLCIAPAGARLSVDRCLLPRFGWRTSEGPSVAANVAWRLMQVHGAAFYVMMGLSKLYGDAWWGGIAFWFLLAQTHSRPVDLTFLRNHPYLINAWTHAVLAYELLFPVLIWNRLARPLLLLVGVVVWTLTALATGLLPFCLGMLVVGAAYIPPETYGRWLGRAVEPRLAPAA